MKLSTLPVFPAVLTLAGVAMITVSAPLASAADTHTILPITSTVSTVPSNGDVNPYGVVFAPRTVPTTGILQPGDILVSNFNDVNNLQGRGTTILRVDANHQTSTYYTSTSTRRGLTAALGVLSNGVVLIGNLPTVDGTAATVSAGNLSVLYNGTFLGTFGTIETVNGPWAMAVYDTGNGVSGTAKVFLSNVLSGVISRFDITYSPSGIGASVIVLASGFSHRVDPAALVLGPTGLAYNAATDTLYVASSTDNAIYAIPTAVTTNSTVSATQVFEDATHLHGPLDLAILPNGHFLVANSDGSNADPNQPSELVEYEPNGTFLAQMPVDPNNGGAFGFGTANLAWGTFRIAYVDDNQNNLTISTAVAQ